MGDFEHVHCADFSLALYVVLLVLLINQLEHINAFRIM